MSDNITAIATLVGALGGFVTAVAGAWISIANNRRIKEVHDNTHSLQGDIKQVKGDMFSLTAVMTQSIAPLKKDP